jgi:diadenosine tetraphosphate (Ap4A) HIT family hydrolase
VWQRLVDEHGVEVGESTVRRFVAEVRALEEVPLVEVMVPQRHPLGEEADVDFGTVSVYLAGMPCDVQLFIMRLSASGRAFPRAYLNECQEVFLDGHVRAFDHFGGVPGRIRYDNLKAAVVRLLRGRDHIEPERFVALRSHPPHTRHPPLQVHHRRHGHRDVGVPAVAADNDPDRVGARASSTRGQRRDRVGDLHCPRGEPPCPRTCDTPKGRARPLPPACGLPGDDRAVTLRLLPESVIEERPSWTLAINLNQDLLGKSMLVLRRHCTAVIDIAPDEWVALRYELRRLVPALDRLFEPDQFNIAFLMNLDAQVHLHVVPRYASARCWLDRTFTDPHWGEAVGREQQPLPPSELQLRADEIRAQLA